LRVRAAGVFAARYGITQGVQFLTQQVRLRGPRHFGHFGELHLWAMAHSVAKRRRKRCAKIARCYAKTADLQEIPRFFARLHT
jgi:hypothetical protein